jgi:hypothetical protein
MLLLSANSQQGIPRVWHDGAVPDEFHSEQLRRESDELLATAAKLIEHAETLKAQAAELNRQIAILESNVPKRNGKKS